MTAITMAPPMPPPPTLERMELRSIPLAGVAAAAAPPDVIMFSSWPPTPPPTRPAIVFPTGPKLNFCITAPAIFPPTPPLTKLTIKGSQFIKSLRGARFYSGPKSQRQQAVSQDCDD